MGDSIRDLLFTTKSTVFNKIRPQEFNDAFGIIKNKYPHLINKIICDIFTGSFQRTFNNYVKAENIEEAYYSPSIKSRGKGNSTLFLMSKNAKTFHLTKLKLRFLKDFLKEEDWPRSLLRSRK